MYPETWNFYRVFYSLVILWCCTIGANGDTDTNVDSITLTKTDSTSDLLKILLGNQNEKNFNPLNSILFTNSSVGSINFNILSNVPASNVTDSRHNIYINNTNTKLGYTFTEGIGYHKIHMRKVYWYDALQACINENAHLTVINSLEEERVLRQILENSEITDNAFIGAHDMFKEGTWVTVNGEPLEKAGFNQWYNLGTNAPANNDYDCAIFRAQGGMDDVTCNYEHYFICEIPL